MKNTNLKAIIFDLDNTLSDRNKCLSCFSNKFLIKYSYCFNYSQHFQIKKQIKISDRNGYRKKDEMFNELLELLPWKCKPGIYEIKEFWKSEFVNFTVPMKNMKVVLETLKKNGIVLGIITNGSVFIQNQKIEKLSIRSYFKSIIISDSINKKKPDPEIFRLSLKELGVNASESIFIGDHPINDIKGALDVGINAIWLKDEEEWPIEKIFPSKIITNLYEIIGIVNNIRNFNQTI